MKFTPPKEKEKREAIGSLKDLPKNLQKFFSSQFFNPIPSPRPYDWLSNHIEEGQTFDDFLHSYFNIPDKNRNRIYLQPLGEFPPDAPSILKLKKYTEAFFMMDVIDLNHIEIKNLKLTKRKNPYTNKEQFLTLDILAYLKKNLPRNAFCLVGITMEDLYPEPSWNFVFGQASILERVALYSFARYDPSFYGEERRKDYKKILLKRSCKVLSHELCHIFGISHCIFYHCVMNGSNHLEESDARPLHLCPVDLRKLHYVIGFDIKKRYEKLYDFYEENDFQEEKEWVKKILR
ncbi:MAG: archaemetzincin [candidate division WOR-3 bacterium]